MILDRMTTLIQKSKVLNRLSRDLKSQLSELKIELESRGIRWSPMDMATLVEQVSPQGSRIALGYVLDYVRPFSSGMGFRITRLSDTQIEILIPDRLRNRTDDGHMHEATLLPAALEAMKIFWQRHGEETIQIRLLKETSHWHQTLVGPMRLKTEMSSPQRELILSQLRQNSRQKFEMKFQIYDQQEKLVAEIETQALIQKVPQLDSSSSEK